MILLVDDSAAQHSLQEKILCAHGVPPASILKARNGREALEIARKTQVRLIVVDWNMPEMNGIEMVRALRQEDTTTPVVMVTSESEQARFLEALEAGANGYVTKPITARALLDAVDSYLG